MSPLIRVEEGALVVRVPPRGLHAKLLLDPLGSVDPGCARTIRVDAPPAWSWTMIDAAFLRGLANRVGAGGRAVEFRGLPEDLMHLLALARSSGSAIGPGEAARVGPLARLGVASAASWNGVLAYLEMVGDVARRLPRLLAGKAMLRRSEVLGVIAESSTRALPIVGVVNFLIGSILAFVGAVQLGAFGAGLYVADLVGIAAVREMVPVMIAIVLAGRTGASFAATIATMQGNEEVDALRTFGVSPTEFLVLPRVVTLALLMPLLYVYGCAAALLGGALVGTSMLDLSFVAYAVETRKALDGVDFAFGAAKSVVFGAMVAVIGCRRGLAADRSAAGVGRATTEAVVASIVGVIAMDAVFAVCAYVLRI